MKKITVKNSTYNKMMKVAELLDWMIEMAAQLMIEFACSAVIGAVCLGLFITVHNILDFIFN